LFANGFGDRRLSLRAELVRLGIRWLMRPTGRPEDTVERLRRQTASFTWWAPSAPAGTETSETSLGGVPAQLVATPASRADRHILYLHGGGYVTGSPALYRHITWRLANATRAQIAAIDYRLAPEHPFPAALDDAVAAWKGLLAQGADPRRVVVMGDSAGGGLSLALGLRLRDAGAALPAAIVAICPWTDLALTGGSWLRNPLGHPQRHFEDIRFVAAGYLAGADPCTPYASPLYGDPAGLPPTLIQVGGDEVLLDDAVRIAERMREAGCTVELEVWPRMPHVWHAFASIMPEARRAISRIGEFVRRQIGER
jgi:monoterpene epsilon-lactone hydrolase